MLQSVPFPSFIALHVSVMDINFYVVLCLIIQLFSTGGTWIQPPVLKLD